MAAKEPGATPPTQPEGHPRERRLRRRAEYLRIYEEGRRLHGHLLVIFVSPGDGSGPRLGITVTRRAGGAVVRNRLRRRVREAFRRAAATRALGPLDFVVNVSPRAARTPYEELRNELNRLLDRAAGPAA
jgi:ribonuclease P protein component